MYFENSSLLENTLLSYFCEEYPLKLLNKKFNSLNYEKYNTYIKLHGIIETYHPKTKILIKEESYKNGKLDGLYQEWYNNCILKSRSNYKNNKLDGLCEEWQDNGI